MGFRIGIGSDLHRLVPGDGIPLGGVRIPGPCSCLAVSDGDVLLHALVDALLGACGKGDIGDRHRENETPHGQDSALFVHETMRLVSAMNARIVNVDCVVNLEKPRLGPWKEMIRANLAALVLLPPARVNVKAKTGEGLGPIGEGLAVSAEAAVLLEVDGGGRMTGHNQSLGLRGEEMAVLFLREKGLRIVDRRVRFKRGEIDIVARNGGEWVFVEVKTRSGDRMGRAAEALTERKAMRMERAVREYMHLNRLDEAPVRCDLIAIDFRPDGPPAIEHFPAAFTWK